MIFQDVIEEFLHSTNIPLIMGRRKWNAELIEEDSPFIGPSKINWKCVNQENGEEEEVVTELDEEKIYPGEDFEYEGEINGKKVKGRFMTGHGPIKSIRAVRDDEELSEAERVAGISHIDWFC